MNPVKKNKEHKWRVLPLEGKYYGTQVQAPNGSIIRLWGSGEDFRPSTRELEQFTQKEIDDSNFIQDYFCDNHYEQQGDLENAKLMVAALNGLLEE